MQKRPNLTLALISLAIFIGAVDLTVVSAALPRVMVDMRVEIGSDLGRAAWVVSGYLLAYTVSMTFMGRLSDILGRRDVYLICLGIFIAGSALAAAAGSLEWLIVGRVVQAFGAGAMVPISMALAGDIFPPERRAAALGVIGAVDTAGWMVGHLYGGVLMRAFDSWRLLFWLNLPIGLLALALTWWALRGVPQRRAAGGFDWLGAALISASLIAFNVGLSAGGELREDFYGERAGPPAYALPLVLAALALLAGFVWAERRSAHPLIDLTIFYDRGAAAACAINVMVGFALALAITNVPLFINTRLALQNPADADILRRAAWESGWMLSALTLTMAAAAVPGGWLAGRIGPRAPALAGLALALAGVLMMSRWGAESAYLTMGLELALAGLGLGLVISPVAEEVIAAAAEGRRGSASALVIALRLVGMTAGVAALTLYGVPRQDALRRAGASNPLASSDPARFLMDVASQVIGETFLLGAAALALALLAALWMRGGNDHPRGPM
ncbi:MFS transporter [Oscillochloris sp. ZM17-4]|uniref:MFS transporter n=1 Tax=Oscillochloris sp. ZM17-4 TaxID=2866714 RepID=UPI0021071555|nr:MFS transporter [Oscillochloris sp. ZM17-4]